MFNFLKKKKCEHDTNYRSRKYFTKDGTPMIEFECRSCGWKDHGHVYADAKDWENRLVVMEHGVEIINETK